MKRLIDNIFKRSEFANKVLGATIVLTFGTVVSRLLIAVAYILLARILTPTEYGEYSMINSTINNFLIFASLGIGLTTTKYISEYKNNNSELASGILGASLFTVLILGLIIGSIFFIFSDYIAVNILKAESLKPLLKYGAVILILTAVNSTQLGALLGLQSYRSTAICNILQGILMFAGIVGGGYWYGITGAIIGNLFAIVILTVIIQILLKIESGKFHIKIKLKTWKRDLKLIYSFAIPASISSLIISPAMWILNTMLVRTPGGYKQLGIYSAVLLFPNAVQMVNGSLNSVLLPIFLAKETQMTAKKEFFNYFGAWIIAIVIGIPFIIYPEIVSVIIGAKYPTAQVVTIFAIIMISTLIISNKQGIARDLIIKNKMWLSVYSMGQWSITSILLFYFLKDYGAIGFASAVMLSYLLNLVLFVPFFVKMKISPSYIFYDKYVIFIWIILFVLIFMNIKLQLTHRLLPSVVLIYLIYYNFKKLYIKTCEKIV